MHQEASHPSEISMKSEVIRKSIHLSSIGIPLIYGLAGRAVMLWLLVPVTIIAVVVEFLRLRVPTVEAKLRRVFGTIMREHELAEAKAKISGATWVFLSATFCVIVFPTMITIAGFTVLIVSDTAAALFGRKFGRHRFLEKSVEGSSAFYVTAMMVVTAVMLIYDAPMLFLTTGAAAAFAATAAEAFSYGANVDDNLTIPTAYGFVQWGLVALHGGPEADAIYAAGRSVFG
jgi:dolichol kinase